MLYTLNSCSAVYQLYLNKTKKYKNKNIQTSVLLSTRTDIRGCKRKIKQSQQWLESSLKQSREATDEV